MYMRGKYAFLSNFYPAKITCGLGTFNNVEAAYQAHKCPSRASEFENLSGKEAKELANTLDVRSDWDDIKINIMRNLLNIKFSDPFLFKRLQAINEPIIEDNYWNDTFWGICTNKKYNHEGKNMLGNLLTEIKNR